MKINSRYYDIALKQGDFGLHSNSENSKGKCGINNNRGYSADYCGSFTGKSETAAKVSKSFLDKILSSDWFGKFAKYSEEHNISTSALIALVLAGICRPATIMAIPGKKDKDDKVYASAQAMASGIIGFIVSTAITSPFDESIKKVFNEEKYQKGEFKVINKIIKKLTPKEEAGTISKADHIELKAKSAIVDARKTFAKNIPDWIIGVPRAMITIALIPPILKYVFGMEKKKKVNKEQTTLQENNFTRINIDKPVFADFNKGGNK